MKTIIKYFAAAAAAVLAYSCTPQFPAPVQSELPQASAISPVITIDQETNYVTFSVKDKGVVPVWIFSAEQLIDGKKSKQYCYTGNGTTLRIREEGKHTVELKVFNKNGLSQGSQIIEFTMDNTYRDPFDPSKYMDAVSGTWVWNYEEDGHFGCGSSIANPKEWWSCEAFGKEGFLYDDVMEFTSDGEYKFDSGDGYAYANKGSEYATDYKTAEEDYLFAVEPKVQTSKYTIENNWNEAGIEEVYLVLESGSIMSYVPHKSQVEEPRFIFMESAPGSIKKKIQLAAFVYTPDNPGGIAWYYEFVHPGNTPGLDYDAPTNIWKAADAEGASTLGQYYAHTNDWVPLDPYEQTHEGDTYSAYLPTATQAQWQAQYSITPNEPIAVKAGQEYAISCLIRTNKDLPGVTVKVTQSNDDDNFLCADRVAVPKGKEFLYMKTGVVLSKGVDAENIKVVLDFGGNEDETSVSVRRITVQEYTAPAASINGVAFEGGKADLSFSKGEAVTVDGIELGYIDPDFFAGEAGSMTFAAEDGDYRVYNQDGFLKVVPMFAGAPATYGDNGSLWIIGEGLAKPQGGKVPGWTTDPAVDIPFAKDGNKYQVTVYVTGPNFKVFGQANWGMELGGDNYTVVEANDFFKVNGFPGGAASDNGNIWSGEAFAEGWYVIKLVDNGDGTFEFYADKKKETYYDIEGETNLYKSATINPEIWYTGADWSGGLTPEYEIGENNDFTATMPAGIGGEEWKGQNKLHTGVATSSDKIYDFCCTLEADEDCVVTIKLTGNPEGDGDPHAFFYDGNVKLEAGVPLTYKKAKISQKESNSDFTVIFDYGRVPEGKTVKATQICFQEHLEK